MNRRSFWYGFATGCVLFAGTLLFGYYKFIAQPDIALNKVEVLDLQGNKRNLTDFKGKPLVVNYWATWCKPCIEEFPDFEKVKEQYGTDINFVMISDEPDQKITSFLAKKSFTFHFLRSPKELSAYGLDVRPVTYFYDAKGKLVDKHTGMIGAEKLAGLVAELLK